MSRGFSEAGRRKKRLSRRQVLKWAGVASGATLMVACAPPVPRPAADTPSASPAATESPTAKPVTPTPNPPALMARPVAAAEMEAKAKWVRDRLFAAVPPFSFVYGGQPSLALLAEWSRQMDQQSLDAYRTQYTFTWTDPQGALEVRCVAVEYADYPVVEWTVWLANIHPAANTLVVKSLQGLDTRFERDNEGEFVLHHWRGDSAQDKSYEPLERELGPETVTEFSPVAGRPTSIVFPYYNLQAAGRGWIVVVGWPGQWRAKFERDSAQGLHLTAGQDSTHLVLKPGEKIRSPLSLLLFWQGADVARAQNIWRRWFMAHSLPRYNGQPPAPLAHIQVPNEEQGLFAQVKAYDQAGVKVDLCWRDAGWYPCDGDWMKTGTWEIDQKAFPNGFRAFTDWIHAQGKKFILWFEPERVRPGTWLSDQHPAWLLTPEGMPQSLLNLGNPEARAWLADHIDQLLNEQGIDYYRQDFNIDPLYYWSSGDTSDRAGLTENFYVQGYLAYWDELRRRHPAMLIDSCASGGRRNDLETLRRAVPLLRSDFQFGPTTSLGNQGHTYGLSSWIPYSGTATYALGHYDARSFYVPAFGVGIDVKPEEAKLYYDECRELGSYMLGDYYPLTPYSLDPAQWIAWQFDQPEAGAGFIQAFRREESADSAQTYLLRGLDSGAEYMVTNNDTGEVHTVEGQVLLTQGLRVEIIQPRDAVVVRYERMNTHGTHQ